MWLLLLHQIPPAPPYFRAKILRRLNQVGALAIKNSAYVVPENEETMEDLQWLRSSIEADGGEAWLFRTEAVAGLSDESLIESFRTLRASDYKQLLDSSRDLQNEPELRKLQRRFDEIRRIDFFAAPGRKEIEIMLEKISKSLAAPAAQFEKPDLKDLHRRIWVTRRGVKVDRIATAWLVRRFIDPNAQFHFVDQDRYQHSAGEIRFDMFEGEFTHEGDRCTFETLLHHVKLQDPALDALAQVIHDIDVKDDKYQRAETNGIAAMIAGVAALHSEDEQRIEAGSGIFDAAYAGIKAAGKS